jgi:hypothetical protein
MRIAGMAFIVTMLTLSACSINGLGLTSSDVIAANGARIVRTETYGVALRTAAEDAGVVIGYSWTLAVIPDCSDGPRVGVHRFGVSTTGVQPIAMVRRTRGIGIDLNSHTIGILLGFSEDAIFSRATTDEPVIRRLVLIPDEPSKIELRQIRQQGS